MVIAVNTRLLIPDRLEGIGWFSYESLKRITRSHPEHTFLFLFDRPFSEEFIFSDNIIPISSGPPSRHPLLWYWWFEHTLPCIFRKYNPVLFLSPDGHLSLRSAVKQIPVIHDLNFEYYPENIPWAQRTYYQRYFPLFAKKAARIATVSEYSKADIAQTYSIDPGKIDVVYNGAGEEFKPLNDQEANQIRNKISGGAPYFLFVGAMNPRKNIARLLKAFDAFKKSGSHPQKLVIAGERMWNTGELEDTYNAMEYRKDVIFTGRLGKKELCDVMGAAFSLTFVPYFEGFGIPIVEAFHCDVPVMTSNVTSMPEVAGEAALLVDPFAVDSIKEGMLRMSQDGSLRRQLITNARKQQEKFSWDLTAGRLWHCIEQIL